MSTIDISKIKPGDKGAIEVTFGERRGSGIEIQSLGIFGGYFAICVHGDAVLSHRPSPREIKVGDTVRPIRGYRDQRGVVLHIDGSVAFVRWQGGLADVCAVEILRHADDAA